MEDPLILLGREMAGFAALVGDIEGDEPVPACPGWTSADVVRHLGSIHRWAAAIVLSGQRIPDEPAARAAAAGVVARARMLAARPWLVTCAFARAVVPVAPACARSAGLAAEASLAEVAVASVAPAAAGGAA